MSLNAKLIKHVKEPTLHTVLTLGLLFLVIAQGMTWAVNSARELFSLPPVDAATPEDLMLYFVFALALGNSLEVQLMKHRAKADSTPQHKTQEVK